MCNGVYLKAPDSIALEVFQDINFKFIINSLGDKPEIMAAFFIACLLCDLRNKAQRMWLANIKAASRFITALLTHGTLI
jgi:hypothetical protein